MECLQLPVIDPIPKDLLQQCSGGNCVRCGLCCIVYKVTVPSIANDIDSKPIEKPSGAVCPQLIVNNRGQFECALQVHKENGDARLAACKNWTGRDIGRMQLETRTAAFAERPYDANALATLQAMIRAGLADAIDITLTLDGIYDVITHYLFTLGVVPIDIFDGMGLRQLMIQLYWDNRHEYERLDWLIWKQNEVIYREFIENYVWRGCSGNMQVNRDAAFAGP